MDKQTKNLLIEASSEITQLRNENKIMGARLDMFDKCMQLFNASPSDRGMGMKEDVVYKIQKHLEYHSDKESNA